ncbi:aminoglycoside phosphotransferase family protein [Tenggerimyces flavus]|uniref:Aminoglycoside phosphotransferase family protein n=1 Tax=Tenggerimyces flavus TaxID=1708749 RepID=A0ABV7YGS9_9ACTN|nr:phosphotransferase [Tenggerimyces flavus]MBM7783395.1 aminoglycoside phosphotransferase (APT) family kinase protein [Tenggerimyces flavus]
MPQHELVDFVNERAGCGLELIGIAPQGQSGGAAFVRWPDGHQSVVTTAMASLDHMRQTAEILAYAKGLGLPVPHHELLLPRDDGLVAVVQERLPGKPIAASDASTIDAMVALNERFAHLLADRTDVPIPPLCLRESGDPVPRHEPLEQHSDRSRRLLKRIKELGAADIHEMDGDDLVHVDLTVPNILFDDEGNLSGVVDWNFGVARGDRRFGLVKLLFDLTWAAGSPGEEQAPRPDALERAAEAVDAIEPEKLKLYWAHWTLAMLYWTIRSGYEEVIAIHLDLGESRL